MNAAVGDLAELKLGRGDSGPAVAEVRDRLVRLGFLDPVGTGSAEVRFDDAVDGAVRAFQQQRGMTVDGVVGPDTFRRLEEARWSLGDRILSFVPAHMITGDDVAELQRHLARLGFSSGRIDGVFGPDTDHAVREFQRNVGAEADGTCGPAVWRALDRLARSVAGGGLDRLQLVHASSRLRTGVAGKVVVLDPGHGGSDYGEISNRLAESIVADDLTHRVEGRLAALGTQVLLTRPVTHEIEQTLSESDRAQFANDQGAHVVVSLHVDAEPTGRASGVSTYYFGSELGCSLLGQRLANLIQAEVTSRTDLPDCQSHAKTWDLLRITRMPTVRVECGYLTNSDDARRLADVRFRDAMADGIAQAVIAFFAP